KIGVASPTTTGPIITWTSSTRACASRSFQRVRLPEDQDLLATALLQLGDLRVGLRAAKNARVGVQDFVCSGLRRSEMTIFSISLSRREISRTTGRAVGS